MPLVPRRRLAAEEGANLALHEHGLDGPIPHTYYSWKVNLSFLVHTPTSQDHTSSVVLDRPSETSPHLARGSFVSRVASDSEVTVYTVKSGPN